MKSSWKQATHGVAFLGIAFAFSPQATEARPEYMNVFKAVYRDYVYETSNCAVCHSKNDKKTRNDYGKAVEEALGAKKVTDVKAIEAALKKCEDKLPGKKR